MDREKLYEIINQEKTLDYKIPDNTKVFYEVVRVNKMGVLFIEGHIKRLNNSLKLSSSIKEIKEEEIFIEILKLIEANSYRMQNINISVFEENKKRMILTRYIESKYPSKELYLKGVDVSVKKFKRENPLEKSVNKNLFKIRDELKKTNYFEFLLEDENGEIREGTRTNVFFLKGNKLYASKDEEVLKGVTREKIIELSKAKFEIIRENLKSSELKDIDGAFLTGTSISFLPIRKIDEIELTSSEKSLASQIKSDYDNYLLDYYMNSSFNKKLRRRAIFKRVYALYGNEKLSRLENSTILVAGIGGVGSNAALSLLRTAVSNIIILDYDRVDISNLNRQQMANFDNLNRLKTDALKDEMLKINPDSNIKKLSFKLDNQTIKELENYKIDYILDALDDVYAKLELAKYAKENNIKIITVMGTAKKLDTTRLQRGDIFDIKSCKLSAKYRRLLRKNKIDTLDCIYSKEERCLKHSEAKVLASSIFVPASAGLFAANEIIKNL